jgi:hypothetical protein
MRETDALAKIDEDFYGALPQWREYFDIWVFVHNSAIGLGPGVEARLLELDAAQSGLRVRWWGREEMRRVT